MDLGTKNPCTDVRGYLVAEEPDLYSPLLKIKMNSPCFTKQEIASTIPNQSKLILASSEHRRSLRFLSNSDDNCNHSSETVQYPLKIHCLRDLIAFIIIYIQNFKILLLIYLSELFILIGMNKH